MTYNALEAVVRKAAKSVAGQWPGVIEADDVEQSIWVRLLESDGSVSKILGMDDLAQYRAVVGIGHQLASEERSDYDYFKGSYRYSVKEVKDLLVEGILEEDIPSFRAERLDLIEAMYVVADQYRAALLSRYAEGIVPSGSTEKDALKNGLTALVDGMNKAQKRRYAERDDGPGTRQVVSRLQALDLSGSEWDGEDDEW